MRGKGKVVRLAAAIGLMSLPFGWASAATCGDLTGKDFGSAHVIQTEEIDSPIALKSSDVYTPGGAVTVKSPFCRVQAVISGGDSEIRVEVWLPPLASWNGKYQSVGNGGFAGIVVYRPMVWALEAGYAVSSTDTGHAAEMNDARWAQGHPEKIVDFGWRAVHETAVTSKAIIQTYYGKTPAHSFFTGCSSGGREALIEAQRFPTDYDGIVAGAPANYWAQATGAIVWTVQNIRAKPENWVSPEKLALINKASLVACHGANGVLDDPGHCHFNAETIQCKNGQTTDCLTPSEVTMMHHLYEDLHDANGKWVYSGLTPGDEAYWGWTFGPQGNPGLGSVSGPFGIGFYRDLIYSQPDWDWHTFTLEKDIPAALESNIAKAVYAENPDLSAFKAAGGKLLHYHGWNDPGIPARASIHYYEKVAESLGGVDALNPFYRLFLGPGMRHCGWGPGPSAVGGVFGFESPLRDPEHDLVSALSQWVESGVAPTQIIATQYVKDDPSQGIAAQRPWCAYPAVARYNGKGDRTKASSYACSIPTGVKK